MRDLPAISDIRPVFTSATVSISSGQTQVGVNVQAPSGQAVIGGFSNQISDGSAVWVVAESRPAGGYGTASGTLLPTGWYVTYQLVSGTTSGSATATAGVISI